MDKKMMKNKRGKKIATSHSQGAKQVKKNSFIRDALPDQVWWCNIKRFFSHSKITSANLCKSISDIINYSTCICPLESEKWGKEGKKFQ